MISFPRARTHVPARPPCSHAPVRPSSRAQARSGRCSSSSHRSRRLRSNPLNEPRRASTNPDEPRRASTNPDEPRLGARVTPDAIGRAARGPQLHRPRAPFPWQELFGRRHLVLNYLFFDGGCGAVGNVVIANLLSSALYERALQSQSANERGHVAPLGPDRTRTPLSSPPPPPSLPVPRTPSCLGPECFGPTHAIVASLCGLAAVSAIILARRSASLYRPA